MRHGFFARKATLGFLIAFSAPTSQAALPVLCDRLSEVFLRENPNFSEGERELVHKAFTIASTKQISGVFAEIGAGQETARFFFRAGKASQAILKSVSEYAMERSDAEYGGGVRYVSRQRVEDMLTTHMKEIAETEWKTKPSETVFFTYAASVTTNPGNGRGWLGLRFQTSPKGPTNDVIVHVNMKNPDSFGQHADLGAVGVNLLYAVYAHGRNSGEFVRSLTTGVHGRNIEIDMVEIKGPSIGTALGEGFTSTEIGIELLAAGHTKQVTYTPSGRNESLSEMMFKKTALVTRVDLRAGATAPQSLPNASPGYAGKVAEFANGVGVKPEEVVRITEIIVGAQVDVTALNSLITQANAAGQNVIVSRTGDISEAASGGRTALGATRLGWLPQQ